MATRSDDVTIDRRVRKSRAALLSAAIRLVSEAGTTEVSVTDLAEAADVSRRVLYQHFGDRDSLLAAAVAHLLADQLVPHLTHMDAIDDVGGSTRALTDHLLANRAFYRAILTGSCAHAATVAVKEVVGPHTLHMTRLTYPSLDDQTAEEVADYFLGGTTMALVDWLTEGADPPDPKEFADRMVRVRAALAPTPRPAAD